MDAAHARLKTRPGELTASPSRESEMAPLLPARQIPLGIGTDIRRAGGFCML